MHKPDHAQHRIIENACAEAGLLDLVIARDNRANPSQIDIIDAVLRVAKNDPGIGRIVRDGVENNPLRAGVGIGAENARVENFQRRRHMIGRGDHIRGGRIRTGQVLLHDEGDFCLDPRLNEATGWNLPPLSKHVLEQRRCRECRFSAHIAWPSR